MIVSRSPSAHALRRHRAKAERVQSTYAVMDLFIDGDVDVSGKLHNFIIDAALCHLQLSIKRNSAFTVYICSSG